MNLELPENHGAMQFFLTEIGTEQTSNRIGRPSFIFDLSLVRGRPTSQLADEESISTVDDVFPEAATRSVNRDSGAATAWQR